jgi:aspartate racemase
MKTIGLIGGISSFSTELYYHNLNKLVNEKLGGAHSASLILHSVDFHEYKELQEKGDWNEFEKCLLEIALKLEHAGASCLVICSNTPHRVANSLQQKINIPLLHIAEETAKEIELHQISKVGLIGTRFTMEHSFFTERLTKRGITCITPDSDERMRIHSSIINEFTRGIFLPETKALFLKIISKLQKEGAQAIIFGCTEIILLIKQEECDLKIFDTTAIHCQAAVTFSLTNE